MQGSLVLEFVQRYQDVSATATLAGTRTQVWDAQLESDRIRFVIVDALNTEDEASLYFEGLVKGDSIEGSAARGVGTARRAETWRVQRK